MSAHTCVAVYTAGTVQHLAKIAHGTGRLQLACRRPSTLTLPPRAPPTHAASAPCIAGACAPRKGRGIRSALFVTRDDWRAQQQHNAECTAATAKRRPQLKSRFSFHKLALEAATFATPGIYTFSCVQHFTFFNKSA